MDFKCVKPREQFPDIETLKIAAKPLVDWANAKLSPHEKVIIELGKVTLIGDEMGFTTEIPD